ncbi:hypothetical protein WA026_022365, partial [Henosepilachna vigintioctopunctata]
MQKRQRDNGGNEVPSTILLATQFLRSSSGPRRVLNERVIVVTPRDFAFVHLLHAFLRAELHQYVPGNLVLKWVLTVYARLFSEI